MHTARPGRGLRPFQVALLILGSRLAPTTSKAKGGPGHGSEKRINLSKVDRTYEAPRTVLVHQKLLLDLGL